MDVRAVDMVGLGAYNLIQNLWLPQRAYVPANVAVAGGLVMLARRDGCGFEDLGLSSARLPAGVAWGVAGAAVVTGVVVAASRDQRTSEYFRDERSRPSHPREAVYRAAVRFPIGTALFEEIAFRGVIEGLWRRAGAGPARSSTAAAVAFALWHLVPTRDALRGNPLGERLASRWAPVMTGAALTGLASLGLSWLRRRSGSLLAPWLTHAAFNTAGYLAGLAAWRRAEAEPVAG